MFFYSDYLKVAASKDTAVNLKLQEASLHHSHKADCYDYGRRRIYAVSKLKYEKNKSFSRKYLWNWFHEKKIKNCFFFYFRMELNFRSPEFTIQSMKLPKVASVAMMYMISIVDSISLCFQIPVPVWVPKLRRFSAAVFWCHLSCMCSSCFVRRKNSRK